MIDLATETLLTLSQAAHLRPPTRQDRPTHPSTIYRWIVRGVRGCKLEALRLGGTLYTSREALQRFAERLTTEKDIANGNALGPVCGSAQAGDPARAADQELTRLGF